MNDDGGEVTEATAPLGTEGPAAARRAEIRRGAIIGRYTVLEALGEGGMATVYSAYDGQLGRVVAMKVLHDHIDTEEVRTRLFREAQAMARLRHPNVLTVYDVGTFEQQIFLAMEYVDGSTLRTWCKEKRPWRHVLKVLKAAGQGLAAAHAAGLVHRDFKPDNVLVGKDGRVLVGDFGIAGDASLRSDLASGGPLASGLQASGGSPPMSAAGTSDNLAEPLRSGVNSLLIAPRTEPAPFDRSSLSHGTGTRGENLTRTGTVLGTLGYIAPELLFDGITDPRCDQFAFAVTMYVTLYGKHPFARGNMGDYTKALRGEPAPPPQSRVPSWIHAVIRRGLQVSPDRRFASMEEMLEALERDPSRRRVIVALGLVGAVACAAGGTSIVRHRAELRVQCDAGDAIVAATWNGDVKRRVHDALERAGGSYGAEVAKRVEARFDDYARAWSSVYRQVTEAALLHGETSRGVLAARQQCLESDRQRLEVLTGVLVDADAPMAVHALEATYNLPAPKACATVDASSAAYSPSDPELRDRLGAVERALAQADALTQVGEDRQALALVQDALPRARSIPRLHADGELLYIVGSCKRQLGDLDGSASAFLDAFQAAEGSGDRLLSARAATGAARVFAGLQRPADAERWLGIGEAALERVSNGEAVEIELMRGRVELLCAEGRFDEAAELSDRALSLVRSLYGEADIHYARVLESKSIALSYTSRLTEASEQLRSSIAAFERIGGPGDPQLDVLYNNLGCLLVDAGRFDEARQALEHALWLERNDDFGARAVIILASLARLEVEARRPAAVLEAVMRGMAIAEAAGSASAVYVPYLLVARGRMHAQQSDDASAREDCRRALAIQEEHGLIAANETYGADALTCLGEAELALHRVPQAIQYLERSVALEHREDQMDLPRACLALARSLRAAGRDPQRVEALLKNARDAFAQMEGGARDVAAIDEWVSR